MIRRSAGVRHHVHLVPDSEADQKTAWGAVFPPNATHKTPEVRDWLDKHPRFKLHFTPTGASWLNMVERFFAEITSRRIRRGSYTSVNDLEPPSMITCFSTTPSRSLSSGPRRPKTSSPVKTRRSAVRREPCIT